MGKTRLFIAIALPQEVKDELIHICHHLKKKDLFVGRCMRPENLHLTLKFIGSVADNVIPQIDQLLKNVFSNTCKAKLGPLGVFPSRRMIRILYANLVCIQLHILAKQIEQSLSELFELQEKDFKNHITIARIKEIGDKEVFLAEVDRFEVKPIEFEIHEFLLIQSELLQEGPMYTTIATYQLYKT